MKLKSKIRLTIIIVTFESSEVIKRCLEKINFSKYKVFVVDNNSKDDTIKIVEEYFPQVDLIKLDQNIGYGRANNIALRKTVTDYALILNPDAFILEKSLDSAINVMDSNKNFALASPLTYPTNGSSRDIEEKQEIENLKNKNTFSESEFIVGGVMFMNMAIFNRIGFFDEDIFMFSEDNEVSQRSIDAGYKNIIINNSTAFHCGAGSSKKTLRTIYRRFWHLGWSKSYWKTRRKGWISVKRSTIRLVLFYLFESLINFLKFNPEKGVSKFAFSMGCLAHFIGLKAFDKNGRARG